jgi:5-oxoprolinase (ATP-hydrolysing) subunit A
MTIDLNADLGEGAGHDEEILDLVSSASIACGFHAADPPSILDSIRAARKRNVAVGAHPSFPDRANFGRTNMTLPPDDIYALVVYQVGAFRALARSLGAEMNHVKPHGALYNMAVRDPQLSDAIVRAICAVDPKAILFAPDDTELLRAAQEYRLAVALEVFADRNYMPDGTLVPRSSPDAFVRDPAEAVERIVRMLRENRVRAIGGSDVEVKAETICVHGDNPEAVTFVRKLRERLEQEGVTIAAPLRR